MCLSPVQGNTNISGAGGGVSGCLNAIVDPSNGNVSAYAAAPDTPSPPGSLPSVPAALASFPMSRSSPPLALTIPPGCSAPRIWARLRTRRIASRTAQGSYSFLTIGGTSASSPAFAGVLALVVQQLGGSSVRLGQADYTLYPLSKQFAASFHDVTTGNNSVVCSSSPARARIAVKWLPHRLQRRHRL